MKKRSFKGLLSEARQRDSYRVASIILDFTEGLCKLMETNGISRSSLARRLGVSPAYITKVLRGNANFTVDSMARLVGAAGGEIHIQIDQKTNAQRNNPKKSDVRRAA